MLVNSCQNCGQSLGYLLEDYKKLLNENKLTKVEIFEKLNIHRYCCRIHFFTYYDEHRYIN